MSEQCNEDCLECRCEKEIDIKLTPFKRNYFFTDNIEFLGYGFDAEKLLCSFQEESEEKEKRSIRGSK